MGGVRMQVNHIADSALGQLLAATSASLLFVYPTVYAQHDDLDSQTDAVEEIIVTGTRIKRKNDISTSPVTQVDEKEFKFLGITRVEDLLNDLPQVLADQSSATNNGATGTATVDLRGLLPIRTLTLLNGRRLPAGSPVDPSVDINQIPVMLIKRVEVLTGGASATYGSDAIAGVVNFFTIDNFQGVQFDYQFSQYRHDNDSSLAQYVDDAGYDLPGNDVSDGDTHEFSLMLGMEAPSGRGNITVYATYRDVAEVTQAERDHSACALNGGPDVGEFFCGGSSTIPDGRFTDGGLLTHPNCVMVPAPTPEDPDAMTCNRVPAFDYATGAPTGEVDSDGNLVMMNEPILPWFGNTSGTGTMPWPGRFDFLVEPGTHTFVDRAGHPNAFYNYAPTNYFMRPDERLSLGALGHHAMGDRSELYVELNYMHDKTVAQLAPSGSFFVPDSVSCGNPFLSQQQFDLICARYNLTPSDSQTVFIGRRNVEGGSRRSSIKHTSYRAVAGIRGEFGNSWSYDAYLNYGEVQYSEVFDDDLSIDRMLRSIDAVADPVSGEAVCASVLDGSDPDCVPWNVFESGAVTQEMLDYITLPIYFDGSTRQYQFNAYISADLGDYGIQLPTAHESVRVVTGIEYRDENLDYRPDETAQMGGAAGFSQQISPVSGGYSVREFFGEAAIPILQGKTAAELVSVDLAYRYSDYSTDKQTNTYKVAAEWAPVSSLRLRASYQRATRVGNVYELFSPLRSGNGITRDGCEGTTPVATFEECRLTGVTSAQYGNIPENLGTFGFVNTRFGGNVDLDPEKSDTVSYGFVFTPEFLPDLTLSVDYFDVEINDAIAEPDPQFVFDSCIESAATRYCDSVNRDPATGLLWLGEGHIVVAQTNIGFIKTSGIDIVASYTQPIGRFGDMSFDVVSTYLDTWDWQEQPGEDSWDCVGVYWNGPCVRPRSEWQSNVRTTWITPWDASISLLWRYAGKVEDLSGWGNDIPSKDYFDLGGLWEVRDRIVIRAGIKNVLDADPPIASFGSGNTWPELYDALGRYWFAGISVSL